MIFILLCSLAVAAIGIYKWLTIKPEKVLPAQLVRELENLDGYAQRGDLPRLHELLRQSNSPLGRSAFFAVSGQFSTKQEAVDATEAAAKEEIHRLESGMSMLDVIITICPLLGLLGTVVGLVSIFSSVGSAAGGQARPEEVAAGIAEALVNTIGGIGVAIPAVMVHGYFLRRVESLSVKLENVLSRALTGFYRYFEVHETRSLETATETHLPVSSPWTKP